MRCHLKISDFAVALFFLATLLPSLTSAAVIKRGSIQGKSVKWTQGTVLVEKASGTVSIRFGANFKTKRGPSLWVYLGDAKPQKRIGRLKAITGAQTYTVSPSIDVSKYSTLFIYCAPFQAVFGSARLR